MQTTTTIFAFFLVFSAFDTFFHGVLCTDVVLQFRFTGDAFPIKLQCALALPRQAVFFYDGRQETPLWKGPPCAGYRYKLVYKTSPFVTQVRMLCTIFQKLKIKKRFLDGRNIHILLGCTVIEYLYACI
jgi:hypothetical protein